MSLLSALGDHRRSQQKSPSAGRALKILLRTLNHVVSLASTAAQAGSRARTHSFIWQLLGILLCSKHWCYLVE